MREFLPLSVACGLAERAAPRERFGLRPSSSSLAYPSFVGVALLSLSLLAVDVVRLSVCVSVATEELRSTALLLLLLRCRSEMPTTTPQPQRTARRPQRRWRRQRERCACVAGCGGVRPERAPSSFSVADNRRLAVAVRHQ